jgi:hypothetical protein
MPDFIEISLLWFFYQIEWLGNKIGFLGTTDMLINQDNTFDQGYYKKL